MKYFIVSISIIIYFCSTGYSQGYIKTIDTIKFENNYIVTRKTCIGDDKGYCQSQIDEYYIDGRKKSSQMLDWENRLSGQSILYYSNGKIAEESFFVKGRRVGMFISYFENGKIKSIGKYKDINCYSDVKYSIDTVTVDDPSDEGVELTQVSVHTGELKDGNWFFYKENGEIRNVEIYDDGILIK